jgi:hypothetical protein
LNVLIELENEMKGMTVLAALAYLSSQTKSMKQKTDA